MRFRQFFMSFLALALLGCRLFNDQFDLKGTILLQDCWLVRDLGGHQYVLVNLPAAFAVDSLRVQMVVEPYKGPEGSYCLLEMLNVVSVKKGW